MRLLYLFLDGVGVGGDDPLVNPLRAARLPSLASLLGDGCSFAPDSRPHPGTHVLHLDATLGIPGLPQSGTGQTTLFTGLNAAEIVGRHFGPYPFSTLRPVLRTSGLPARLAAAGRSCAFANAFPERYFRHILERPRHVTATALAFMGAGFPLAGPGELRAGRGISADITGEGWKSLGHPGTPVVTPEEAGRTLVALLGGADLVLFEYWHTDRAGHAQNRAEAVRILERFDTMLGGVLASLDPATTLLVITSDHGNVEDLSVKTHTRNPVPLILHGLHAERIASRIRRVSGGRPDLSHVAPALAAAFESR